MKRMNQTNTKKDKHLRYVAESIHRCLTSQIKATSESIGRKKESYSTIELV